MSELSCLDFLFGGHNPVWGSFLVFSLLPRSYEHVSLCQCSMNILCHSTAGPNSKFYPLLNYFELNLLRQDKCKPFPILTMTAATAMLTTLSRTLILGAVNM